jgi:ABC-2 type transport system ATP-binding protein
MQELLTRLEVETFVFDLTKPLHQLPDIRDFEIQLENPTRLKVTLKKEQDLNSVFEIFSNSGIEISSMRNETGRLEELFLGLVESNLKAESA